VHKISFQHVPLCQGPTCSGVGGYSLLNDAWVEESISMQAKQELLAQSLLNMRATGGIQRDSKGVIAGVRSRSILCQAGGAPLCITTTPLVEWSPLIQSMVRTHGGVVINEGCRASNPNDPARGYKCSSVIELSCSFIGKTR
jgi:hypothetical protein